MRWPVRVALASTSVALASCASNPNGDTLARLHDVPADTDEVVVADSLERAMDSYRRFLDETPDSTMTPEAMRRLADLQIEQQFGIMGTGEIIELPAPELALGDSPAERAGAGIATAQRSTAEIAAAQRSTAGRALTESSLELPAPDLALPDAASLSPAGSQPRGDDPRFADLSESEEAFEQRATAELQLDASAAADLALPDGSQADLAGPLEAIRIYQQILDEYPSYERADQVLYQMARAYDEVGQPDDAMAVIDRLIAEYGYSDYLDEVQFRRGEYLFTRRAFREAEGAYGAIISMGPGSSYYELALYKLGWTLYKQEFYDEALHRFMGLLDYKLSIGYDFDAEHNDDEERRVADTYRVISLSFSNIGGPEVVSEYFADNGNRSYEDRIYSNLGEFYLDKLRYNDAAAVYDAFVELYPFHRESPRFGMRIVDIYEQGGFPLLVVESKKDFATKYGLSSEYWDYFDSAELPEVLGFLKTNLTDLANHYHALYQDESLADEQLANFNEASGWYREFLGSFPAEPETPSINYQLADLLLEQQEFGAAAREYERTAYEYAPHEQASAAGYAAIYAYREQLEVVDPVMESEVLRATVDSSLRFADTFPEHEHAAVVLGAAADDLYTMNDFEMAIAAGSKLIERYPQSDPALRRAAWTVVAHASFDLDRYAEAENAYARVLDFVPEDDEERESLIDNLAASIYQQGDQAMQLEDYRAAADHFLRIRDAAPTSAIRSSAEYDAAAALIQLQDWAMAGRVLEEFRAAFPEHELQGEVTKQLASVYREAGQLDRSAEEYVRVADESADPELAQEALLLAGELYEDASRTDSALEVYRRYVDSFPYPLDLAQETRNTMAGIYESRYEVDRYHDMLREIVASDDAAGVERTDRSRYLAAQSALVLTRQDFDLFVSIELVQPFDQSLAEKQRRMDEALASYEHLVSYEVSEVTAAATYYIAEIYYEFSQALLESERPADLAGADLLDYELAIEEEAYPFEEQAIEVHEQNYALIKAGVFNPWIERSLGKLAEVMPGRYAKSEISGGYLGSMDFYVYQSPGAPAIGVAEDAGQTAPDGEQPQAANIEGEDSHAQAR